MATVHSLVCWGGRTGKNVTLTVASPCVVTSTDHGLRDGTGLVFSTTGALPTGITAGTTYYAKSTAANTFNLYDTAANAIAGGTTGRINTSGTQSGTHTAKSRLMLDYFDQYPGRWGDAGSERCYDSVVTWLQGRASASALDTEVCELGQSFVDERTDSTVPVFNLPAARTIVTPTIDGVFTEAFHFGVIGQGYELYRKSSGYNCIHMTGRRITLFGFTAKVFLGYYGYQVIYCDSWNSLIRGMIIIGGGGVTGYGTTEDGILLSYGANITVVENNLVLGCLRGIKTINYLSGLIIAGNTLVQNATGMAPAAATNIYGDFYNNVCIGNGTNWGDITYNANMSCGYNAGLEGEAWVTGSNPRFTIATTDFESFPTDMRPAAGASVIDAGIEYFEIATVDLAGNERPNYNNGGAEAFDIGCYEYDHGYGDHPATATISLTNVISGSRVLITRDDTSAVLYNDVPGTALDFETGYIGDFTVIIRKASASPYYREFTAGGTTVADQISGIKVMQQLDE